MKTSRCSRAILGLGALLCAGVCAGVFFAGAAHADEIRLKDGKKLHGVIVAYEDNMFKVKTDFGYVLVEKDKIESIIPDTPADETGSSATAKPATKSGAAAPTSTEANKQAKASAIVNSSAARPTIPLTTAKGDATPPPIKSVSATPTTASATSVTPPPPPKAEPPPIKEEIQGNLYLNHEFLFRMYKAPSWQIIADAGQSLPNAIVAMGTSNESTLLVVGHEKSSSPLESAAQEVEKKLSEVYDNYWLISQRKTVLGGLPALEYKYRGMADGHDWSGTLAVVPRNGDVFTVLGMTYADTDLIQIQENVIARAIASIDFNVK
ncbi:MAG TPA: hypothetical protein VK728_18370 [Candidatus Sulfotelmatobacter sp.]|jgi:hypothetical protein|nr:hypothetical protein [Candidatus Sulfotelmatobacter sp.]